MIERMVVGFAFTEDRESVILIRKNRPEWQKGKLNGVGGHIHQGEHPNKAMEREFEEETGVFIHKMNWERMVMMEGNGWHVTFFRTWLTRRDVHMIKSLTDEEVVQVSVKTEEEGANAKILTNLSWLLPLCLDDSGIQFPLQVRDVS